MTYAEALDAVARSIAGRAKSRARNGQTDAWHNLGTHAAADTLSIVYAESYDLTFEELTYKINELRLIAR